MKGWEMKLTKWLSVFVLATTVSLLTGCEPAGETTGGTTTTAPEGSSGTGGGVEAPMGDDLGEETAAPATDESAPADDAPADE